MDLKLRLHLFRMDQDFTQRSIINISLVNYAKDNEKFNRQNA
jgi:hypothetical protein